VDLGTERRAWTLVYLCLGVVEGGTAGVMVRALFAEQVPSLLVDLVLAMVTSAPAWSNIASLLYARRAQGRTKIAFLQPLLFAMCACVGLLAVLPGGTAGLLLYFAFYGSARLLWAGVETVRAVLWSVNYPRRLRARITSRITMLTSVALAVSGLGLGGLLELERPWYRAALLLAALCGVAGALAIGRLRVRGEQELLVAERRRLAAGVQFSYGGIRDLLRADPEFRRYMYAMSLFGAGNLMLTPLLVIAYDDVLHLPTLMQVALTTAVPVLMIPLAIPPWAHYLDRHHVVVFRSIHGWATAAAAALLMSGVLAQSPGLLWPGAMLMGISFAGASLGWSLGHNDFAPRGEETRYMALHVTLTGVRGLVAPPIGIAVFYLLERLTPGSGPWALFLPLALLIAGAGEFNAMRRQLRRSAAQG
jgi:MFS family permease